MLISSRLLQFVKPPMPFNVEPKICTFFRFSHPSKPLRDVTVEGIVTDSNFMHFPNAPSLIYVNPSVRFNDDMFSHP